MRRSAASRLLRLWVRTPPGAWMFVCCECCVLSGRVLCDELITRPEESYRLWSIVVCDRATWWTRRPWPTGGTVSPKERKKILAEKTCCLGQLLYQGRQVTFWGGKTCFYVTLLRWLNLILFTCLLLNSFRHALGKISCSIAFDNELHVLGCYRSWALRLSATSDRGWSGQGMLQNEPTSHELCQVHLLTL